MNEIEFTPTPDSQSPSGVYIPSDIQDCFRELDVMLPTSLIECIRVGDESDLIEQHFGLGMWMRSNWGLWSDWSRLKQYFDNLGVNSADSISSLILASYWRYLNGCPIEVVQTDCI